VHSVISLLGSLLSVIDESKALTSDPEFLELVKNILVLVGGTGWTNPDLGYFTLLWFIRHID
jgi:hypothetical protein